MTLGSELDVTLALGHHTDTASVLWITVVVALALDSFCPCCCPRDPACLCLEASSLEAPVVWGCPPPPAC